MIAYKIQLQSVTQDKKFNPRQNSVQEKSENFFFFFGRKYFFFGRKFFSDKMLSPTTIFFVRKNFCWKKNVRKNFFEKIIFYWEKNFLGEKFWWKKFLIRKKIFFEKKFSDKRQKEGSIKLGDELRGRFNILSMES